MLVGITFDCIEDYLCAGYDRETVAEFDTRETIDAIDGALRSLGHDTERLGDVRSLAHRIVAGSRWDLVFNIAEGLHGFGRESQVPAILDAFEIPYTFSDPLVLALTLHKGMAKHVLRDLGIPTPDFAVVADPEELTRLSLPFPLFVKPVAEGTSKGISAASRVTDRHELAARCAAIIAAFRQPALVETYLPGRECTVGILGTGRNARCLGVLEVALTDRAEAGVYSFDNKKHYHDRVRYRLADDAAAAEAAETALRVWRGLGCRDAGRVDLREDETGRVHCIEVNPLAGLHPLNSDLSILAGRTGLAYGSLIGAIVDSACERLKRQAPAAAS